MSSVSEKQSTSPLSIAARFYRAETSALLGALILVTLSTAIGVLKPWPIAWIVDGLLGQRPLPRWILSAFRGFSYPELIAVLSLALFALHTLQGLFTAGQNYLSIKIGLRGLFRVREALFAKLERLSLRFFQNKPQGDLIYRSTWDTYAFQTLFQQGFFALLTAFASLAVMTVIMWRLDPQLTFVALATIPLLLVSMLFFARRMKQSSTTAHAADSSVMSFTQQSIASMLLIQSFNRQAHEAGEFSRKATSSLELRGRQHRWEVLYWSAMALIFGAATAGLLWLGAGKVLARQLTVGELTVFLAYLAQLYDPLNQISRVGATLSDALTSVERVQEILAEEEELQDPELPEPVFGLRPRFTLENVSFHYTPATPVLQQINLTIREGDSVAIIGPSGAGKTTLLHLLPRFYDPDSGSIKLGGTDLRKLRLADLRSQIALVQQEPILLPGTLRQNIVYGLPSASQEDIEKAATAAYAHHFILKLPKAYDTDVGEGAARLSVGEKQRINLARAFLKNAPILLLDEPTSALDSESEALVIRSLTQLMSKRTTIMVAHRLATLKAVKTIIVLQNGRITETGSLTELLKNTRSYLSRSLLESEHPSE